MTGENGFSTRRIRAFYDWCVATEANNNVALTRTIDGLRIDRAFDADARNGILIFRGHQWSVRKNPHWRIKFAENFPLHYALFISESEAG